MPLWFWLSLFSFKGRTRFEKRGMEGEEDKRTRLIDLFYLDYHHCVHLRPISRLSTMPPHACWFSLSLFVASTTALMSTSSSHHIGSTIVPKSTVPIRSTSHTSTSIFQKTTVSTSTIHRVSSSSTTPPVAPTSTSSTFYLVAADTGQTAFDGSYLQIIPDPSPLIQGSGDRVLQFGQKTPQGAANFTLNADGTLQCNSGSGPLVASISNGHPFTQKLQFEDPDDLTKSGLATVTCGIAGAVLTCQWYSLTGFYFEPSDVVDAKQLGDIVDIGPEGDGESLLNIKVVYV